MALQLDFRKLASVLAVALACALQSCSYTTTFFVANASSSSLHVIAMLDPRRFNADWCTLEPGKYFPGPAVVEPLELDNWTRFRHDPKAISFDRQRCLIELDLPRGKSLALWQLSGYSQGHPVASFPTKLGVRGQGINFSYDGLHLDTFFKVESRTVATLTFQ